MVRIFENKENQITGDIFFELKEKVGCQYISDLKYEPFRTFALEFLLSADLSFYPLEKLSSLAMYFGNDGLKFKSYNEAKEYFKLLHHN